MIFILSHFPHLSEAKKKQIQQIQQVLLPNRLTQKVREVGCLRSQISRINEKTTFIGENVS